MNINKRLNCFQCLFFFFHLFTSYLNKLDITVGFPHNPGGTNIGAFF